MPNPPPSSNMRRARQGSKRRALRHTPGLDVSWHLRRPHVLARPARDAMTQHAGVGAPPGHAPVADGKSTPPTQPGRRPPTKHGGENYLGDFEVAALRTLLYRTPSPADVICVDTRMARWRSGDAADCKSVHPGSIPGRASTTFRAFCAPTIDQFVGRFAEFVFDSTSACRPLMRLAVASAIASWSA